MGRTIVVILLIGLAFWAIRTITRKARIDRQRKAEPRFEKTVRCARCGVHVSVRLALERNGEYYCCREHLPDA